KATDPRLTDFAKLNGATGWRLFRSVHWRQVAPESQAVWLITYLLCLWDVETLVLIIPPGCETLAVRIFNLLHYGHNAQVNALCVILLALAVLPMILWRIGLSSVVKFSRLTATLALLASLGCEPVATHNAPVNSRIFSTVQIIGS